MAAQGDLKSYGMKGDNLLSIPPQRCPGMAASDRLREVD